MHGIACILFRSTTCLNEDAKNDASRALRAETVAVVRQPPTWRTDGRRGRFRVLAGSRDRMSPLNMNSAKSSLLAPGAKRLLNFDGILGA